MLRLVKWSLAAMLMGAFAASATARANDLFRGFPDFDGRKIGHVWVIVLENEGFDTTFGPNSLSPFLSKTLPSQGVMLNQYYATGHVSLDNYVSMVSGQGPTVQTRVDCTFYDDFKLTGITPDGQAIGTGCVYPPQIKTLADQLTAARLSWKGYMEDMGNNATREQAKCGQPLITVNGKSQVALNQLDDTQSAQLGDQYAARHNPFAYFHSLIDSGQCAQHVVNFNQLQADLAFEAITPHFSFITPNLCHDGHDGNGTTTKCVDQEPGGLVSVDAFLKQTVPMIMNSQAYKKDGLIIITFDEGGLAFDTVAGNQITAEGISCCGQQPGPNIAPLLVPGQPLKLGFENANGSPPNFFTSTTGFGGDRTGAVLLSPFLKPGTVSNVPFNHYSMLKTVEDIFGLDYLGYAGQPGLQGFFGCTNSDIRVGGDDDQFSHCQRDRD
jgi:phosphatidylinositol-3-phosphatase